MADLYAIVVKAKDSQDSEVFTNDHPTSFFKRKLIFCSRDPNQLRGYIKIFLKSFDEKNQEYDLVNIQPLINSGFITRKSLSDITDCHAYSTLRHEGITT